MRVISISSGETIERLLEKGKNFLTSAKANLERGLYDVACFEADQATQLILKAYIQKLGGSVPRTHSIRRLLAHSGSLTERKEDVNKFASKFRAGLITLEDAYLRARYAVERYVKGDADLCIKMAEEVIKFAESLTRG